MSPFTEISILFSEGIINKIAYVSVDERNLSRSCVPKNVEKKNLVNKGIYKIEWKYIYLFTIKYNIEQSPK